MRQTFTFAESRHKPPQALAALKNRVRKYVKRERRKALPEGVDYWDFDCKVGDTEATATVAHISEVTNRMEAIFTAGSPTVYVEVLAKPGVRGGASKPAPEPPAEPIAETKVEEPVEPEDAGPSSGWSFG